MKIYDITQELLGCEVYPGDPVPEIYTACSMARGDKYNLSYIKMCLHNGTHIDAPLHFINGGKGVDELDAKIFCGPVYVAEPERLDSKTARDIITLAEHEGAGERILIKGEAVVTLEAAETFSMSGVRLIGVESQSVGPTEAPMDVHIALLSHEIVLLEGIRLHNVNVGAYTLFAQPLKILGADGAPCRAILIEN